MSKIGLIGLAVMGQVVRCLAEILQWRKTESAKAVVVVVVAEFCLKRCREGLRHSRVQ